MITGTFIEAFKGDQGLSGVAVVLHRECPGCYGNGCDDCDYAGHLHITPDQATPKELDEALALLSADYEQAKADMQEAQAAHTRISVEANRRKDQA